YGIRQELYERSCGAESLKHQIPKIVAGYFLVSQWSADGEVLALDVFDKRVSRVVTGWRPLQRFACRAACCAKGSTRGRSAPPFGISGDLVSKFFERLGLGLPNSAADHAVAWFEMEVICRSCPGLSLGMPKVCGGMGFVRTFVLREANVPIDAHERTSVGSRISDEIRIDLFETWRQIGDQSQEWHPHVIFVAPLVRKKPLPLVVELEVLEKSEQARPEITVRCHGLPRHLRSIFTFVPGIFARH